MRCRQSRPRSVARVHTSSVLVRNVAVAFPRSISAEAYTAVGTVTVSLMRASAKMRGEERADAPISFARDLVGHSSEVFRAVFGRDLGN